jgi:hypothetical protein
MECVGVDENLLMSGHQIISRDAIDAIPLPTVVKHKIPSDTVGQNKDRKSSAWPLALFFKATRHPWSVQRHQCNHRFEG